MSDNIVSAVRRADQIFSEQLGEKVTLECGIAFIDTEYPHSIDDNVFREVWVDQPEKMPAAWSEVEQFYAQRNVVCRGWVPALGQPLEVVEPFLLQKGLVKHSLAAMCLAEWPEIPADDGLRVLPARAMRRAFRELYDDARTAEAEERRFDQPQFDVFVALAGDQVVGRCGLLQVGEIANVRNLYVRSESRRRRVGSTLLAHTVEMARRLMMKIVCANVDVQNTGGIRFLESCGFERAGESAEFYRT